jgi:hypothetical protein
MARVFAFFATPAAVGGGLTVMGDSVMRAGFVGVLAGLAVASFRAITAGWNA